MSAMLSGVNPGSFKVQELSFEEIDEVGGGLPFLVPIVVPIVIAVIAGGAGYITARSTDDCVTTTTKWTEGNVEYTRTTTVCT